MRGNDLQKPFSIVALSLFSKDGEFIMQARHLDSRTYLVEDVSAGQGKERHGLISTQGKRVHEIWIVNCIVCREHRASRAMISVYFGVNLNYDIPAFSSVLCGPRLFTCLFYTLKACISLGHFQVPGLENRLKACWESPRSSIGALRES